MPYASRGIGASIDEELVAFAAVPLTDPSRREGPRFVLHGPAAVYRDAAASGSLRYLQMRGIGRGIVASGRGCRGAGCLVVGGRRPRGRLFAHFARAELRLDLSVLKVRYLKVGAVLCRIGSGILTISVERLRNGAVMMARPSDRRDVEAQQSRATPRSGLCAVLSIFDASLLCAFCFDDFLFKDDREEQY